MERLYAAFSASIELSARNHAAARPQIVVAT